MHNWVGVSLNRLWPAAGGGQVFSEPRSLQRRFDGLWQRLADDEEKRGDTTMSKTVEMDRDVEDFHVEDCFAKPN